MLTPIYCSLPFANVKTLLTTENLDNVTGELLAIVRQAMDNDDQSLENIAVVADIFERIVQNDFITPDENVSHGFVALCCLLW